jgi:hypothetical protein
MRTYKNFTEAMKDHGFTLNVRETRLGYAKNPQTGGLYAISVTKTNTDAIKNQGFSDDGSVLIAELKHRGNHDKTMNEKTVGQKVKIFTGGDHAEVIEVSRKVKSGNG